MHLHTFVTGMGLSELHAAKASGAKTIVTTHSSSLGFVCARGTLMQWGETLCDGIATPTKCAACVLDARGVERTIARAIGRVPASVARFAARIPGRVGTTIGMRDVIRRNIERQRELLETADHFVVLTDAARRVLHANGFGHGNIVVNRLGVGEPIDDARDRGSRDAGRPITVGYVGRFDVIKGVEVLAKAVTLLEPDVPLIVEFRGRVQSVAERAVRARLERIAGDDRRIRFAEPVRHDQIADVLRRYDALCCPAICFEGGPTVALEAQAVGTPVIGSRIGGLAEIVNDGIDGRLVEPHEPSALAAALREISINPACTVDVWRAHAPRPRTMQEVSDDYLRLYTAC